MLQYREPKDFVFATGKLHRVSDWLDIAFGCLELDWKDFVQFDERFTRSVDPISLVGNAANARDHLRWVPQVSFESMVHQMVEADRQRELR